MRIIADIFEYTSKFMPRFNSISISGYHMQEAGATADIELAYTLADGLEYLRTGINAGIDIDAFAPTALLFLGNGDEPFHGDCQDEGSQVVMGKDCEAVQSEKSKVHGPYEHIPRLRDGALPSRILSTMWPVPVLKLWRQPSGIPSRLHTNALDEAIALPTDFSARIARNTQIFLQEETEICRSLDPWAGSYYVEYLTQEIANKAWQLIMEVEDLGGMAKAIETGLPKMRIEEAAARKQARIDSQKRHHCGCE